MKFSLKNVLMIFLFSILLVSFSGAELLFEKSEFAARRLKLMEQIPDGIAVILGASEVTGYNEFFQNNDFMYFSGVEIPNAMLIIDGMNKESTLFFTITERKARGENISLDLVHNPSDYTGIEKYYPIEQFSSRLARLSDRVDAIYTSFKPEELMRECSNEKFNILKHNILFNEWDGRLTRELQFVKLLRDRFPQVDARDSSQMIGNLRLIKSSAEVEWIRKAGKIGVKALIEMMKATRPGVYEYEIAAWYEYLCKKQGVRNLAYIPIISSEENHSYLHYHKHNRLLEDGDFLVVDAGPDVG